jgi:hypothetical protein
VDKYTFPNCKVNKDGNVYNLEMGWIDFSCPNYAQITIYTIDVTVPFAGVVKYDIKVIRTVTLSFTPYSLCFHAIFPFSVVSAK